MVGRRLFPFGASSAYFQGRWLLVLGSVCFFVEDFCLSAKIIDKEAMSHSDAYPIASMGRRVYLPTNLPQKSTIHVGKYTSPMDALGI